MWDKLFAPCLDRFNQLFKKEAKRLTDDLIGSSNGPSYGLSWNLCCLSFSVLQPAPMTPSRRIIMRSYVMSSTDVSLSSTPPCAALRPKLLPRKSGWVLDGVLRLQYYLREAFGVLSIIKISWDLVAARSGHELWNAFDRVRSLATTQVSGFGCVEEVLLHICGHLHFYFCSDDFYKYNCNWK